VPPKTKKIPKMGGWGYEMVTNARL